MRFRACFLLALSIVATVCVLTVGMSLAEDAQTVTPSPPTQPPINWGEVWTKFVSALLNVPAVAIGGGIVLILQRGYARLKLAGMSQNVANAIKRKIDSGAKKLPNVAELHARLKKRLESFVNTYGKLPVRPQEGDRKRIVAVVSGKGGVGKSTLSLGLAEYFATSTSACLIDLDMPNRGLTSLLEDSESIAPGTTLFQEFTKFHDKITPKTTGEETPKAPEVLQLPKGGILAVPRFGGAKKPINARDVINGGQHKILPNNGFLLRSIVSPDLYLASDIFTASEVAVREFIFSLETRMPNGVSTMIIDCHGAHDLLMVGAIQAATDIVVTMTAETGSFDGTFELLAYALSNAAQTRTVSITLVINNVASWQEKAANMLKDFFDATLKSSGAKESVKVNTLIVRQSDNVRRVMGHYEFGAVSKTPLWNDVSEIGHNILNQPMNFGGQDIEASFVAQDPPQAKLAQSGGKPR